MHSVRVELGERGYDVIIGPGAIQRLDSIIAARPRGGGSLPRRAVMVLDAGIAGNTAFSAVVGSSALASVRDRLTTMSIRPSESVKTLETLGVLLEAMTRARLERDEPVLAVGGGIVGDIAGFAAASYRRGVPVVQCPTTLLAMVDASVGGKTGVNVLVDGVLKKNMAGAFHQPIGVIADTDALNSLPEREFSAGLAECIKHALIARGQGMAELTDSVERDIDAARARDAEGLASMIARNVALKARVVAGDEREEDTSAQGGRALLNLGHTFAHAIETLPGVSVRGQTGTLLHGEAVGLGLCAAFRTAEHLKTVESGSADWVAGLVRRAGLPDRVGSLPTAEELVERMRDDKKVLGGRLRLVLPTGRGTSTVVENPPLEAVVLGLRSIGAS